MRWCKKDKTGECKLTLRKLIGRANVKVQLSEGLMFIDEVMGVVTENGADFAVFSNRDRVPVASIELVELS